MKRPTPDLRWRPARDGDAGALCDLERDTNLIGLAHVFGELPFPSDGVLARWQVVLDDPEVVVEVVEDEAGLVAYLAHDGTSLRHLGVRPDHWGRGVAAAGVARAEAAGASRLWVLELNTRARALYERLGWEPTGVTQDCPWEPHPIELEYALPT